METVSQKNIILRKSQEIFFKYGVKHVTMDDIAEKCRVSKKTIYKYFESKDHLLHCILVLQVRELQNAIRKNQQEETNSLEKLMLFFTYVKELSQGISVSFVRELKKYHSAIFMEILKYKNTIIIPFVIENIKRGKQEGVYKNDLDAEQICNSFNEVLKTVFFDGLIQNSEESRNALEFLNSLFLHRLVSIEGLKIITTRQHRY